MAGFSKIGLRAVDSRWGQLVLIAMAVACGLGDAVMPACAGDGAGWDTTVRHERREPMLMSLPELGAKWPELDGRQRANVLETLIAAGRFPEAQQLVDRAQPGDQADRLFLRFYTGMILKGQGRRTEAIAVFREILAEKPEYARVRLELAHSLYAGNEDEGARHHFELVLGGSAANSTLASTVNNYIAAIERRRKWDFSAYMTIAPSSNLNQGSENRVVYINGLPFVIDDANRKKSGVGLSAGFQGSYRQPVTDRVDLIVSGGAQGKRYNDDDFNDALANVAVGPRYRFDRGFVGLYAIADHRWYADENYATSWGGLVSGSVRLGAQDIVYADLACSRRSFETDWFGQDLSYQDGHACQASGRLDHYFDAATFARVLGGGGQERTGQAHLDNDSWFAGAGLYREFGWGFSVYVQGLYTQRDYDGLYPTMIEARGDDRYDASLFLTKRDWEVFGFAPMAQYTYTLNESNVGFFDYDAHGVNLTLTKRY